MNHLEETGLLARLERLPARLAEPEELLSVHTPDYLRIAEILGTNGGSLDVDTVLSEGSWQAASTAAGSAVTAVEAVVTGNVDGGCFVLARPPGHHAFADRGSGFCLLNNIAIAARAARDRFGLGRVAIIDWDAHHGNGTQSIFAVDQAVLYTSLHQYPHYPGTGGPEERDEQVSHLNIPLSAGSGDAEYLRAFTETLMPAVRRHRPDIILVSAGYDGHRDDPLSSMELTEAGFAAMTRQVKSLAAELCGGRMVFILEGGYHHRALAESVAATVREMVG